MEILVFVHIYTNKKVNVLIVLVYFVLLLKVGCRIVTYLSNIITENLLVLVIKILSIDQLKCSWEQKSIEIGF